MFAKRFVALLLLLACVSASAATAPPVDGIYWDPSESGRGYAVETQDDLMFVAIYNYDTDGSPSFYVIQGGWNGATHQIDGAHLLQVTSGPWIGSPFSPIGSVVDKGPVTFQFTSFTTASFTYNGHTSNLERFLYGYGAQCRFAHERHLVRGVWRARHLLRRRRQRVRPLHAQRMRIDSRSPSTACASTAATSACSLAGASRTGACSSCSTPRRATTISTCSTFASTTGSAGRPRSSRPTHSRRTGSRCSGAGCSDRPTRRRRHRVQRRTCESVEAMKIAASARIATRPAVDGKAVRVDDIEAMLPALKQALSKLH